LNGQEKEAELNESITSAEFWEYDGRIGRRWNVDPRPSTSISTYASLNNNPIFYIDPQGDTSGVYSRTIDTKTQTSTLTLLYQTYAKGKNTAVILNDKESKIALSHMDDVKKLSKFIDDNKNNAAIQNAMEGIFNDPKYKSEIYDIHSFESFQNSLWNKGTINSINGGAIATAFNITIGGKVSTRSQLQSYIKSLGVGPEYIASVVNNNGIFGAGTDIKTDNDLVSASPLGRFGHIHIHPPVALKTISFSYVKDGVIQHTTTGLPIPKNNGLDRQDRSSSNYFPFSVMVDGAKVYLYTPGDVIRFNRVTRKYEK
jgi:hypothetical protein